MSDLIDRQAALNAFGLSEKTRKYGGDHSGYNTMALYEIQDVLEGLPSAVPEYKMDEWCTDCQEYDQGKHCCPRFNRVIRETLREVQSSDLIRRQDAIDAVCMGGCGLCKEAIEQIGGKND